MFSEHCSIFSGIYIEFSGIYGNVSVVIRADPLAPENVCDDILSALVRRKRSFSKSLPTGMLELALRRFVKQVKSIDKVSRER
jgi:hypothetical protein